MNKKGFTLIELIAVVAILGIIALIAVPNIINMVDNGKKSQFVTDAREMISKAKYQIKLEKYKDNFTTVDGCKVISASKLGFSAFNDPDGNSYILNESLVKMCIENSEQVFYVVTKTQTTDTDDTSRGIYDSYSSGGYVKEICLIEGNRDICNDLEPKDYVVELP